MTKPLSDIAAYQPAVVEEKFYKKWDQQGCFRVTNTGASTFTIIMPPANVTGNLHLGHALTFTLQDILVRFERMRGKDVLWQPGTDHAGIATQMVVERQLEQQGLDRRRLGKEAFLEKVWEWKEKSGGAIVDQLKRLGASADWDRERFTMDPHASACVTKAFVKLYQDGLIYKDKRLVNWDTKYQTAISDLEVEHRETQGNLYYIKYPLENGLGHIVVATTRPETCFADSAVAVNPSDERYKEWIGKSVSIPFTNRSIPIIADGYSDPEKGTGAVKITPGHDFNDFEVGKRHNLEFLSVIDEFGKLNDQAPVEYRGLGYDEARHLLVKRLEEAELLEKVEDMAHSVPFGDRSGTVIQPRLTDQWYVRADVLAEPALKAVKLGDTGFIPEQWANVYFEWLNNIQPWCISRQLWWGHPIPAWYGPDGHVFVAEALEDAQKSADEYYGKTLELQADPDVLDTWFSSGLWPFVTLDWPESNLIFNRHYPTSVLVTGFDIIFFWVARMMMMGIYFTGKVPFKTVYIHALVRDAKGQKMSKSKGNVMDPLDLIDKYGADALRFTLSSLAAPGRDIRMSEEKVSSYRNFTTKIWNALRYAQMQGCMLDASFDPTQCGHPLNQWMVSKTSELATKITKSLEEYAFHEASHELYHFLWGSFCDWYLEFTKPILTTDSKTNDKIETQKTIAWVLGRICHFLHPFMPFLTEEIWEKLGGEGLLIKAPWPTFLAVDFKKAQTEIDFLIDFISGLRSLRSALRISPGYLVNVCWNSGSDEQKLICQENMEILKRLGRIKQLHMSPFLGRQKMVQMIVQKTILGLDLEDVINLDQEITRLQKELEKIQQEKKNIEGRLSNPDFRLKAPAAIIQELEERLAHFSDWYAKTESIVDQMKRAL